MLCLVAGALCSLFRGHLFRAGFLIGLGTFKFQIVVPMLALFLLWRRWRIGVGVVASAALVLLISLWLVGPAQMKVYGTSLLSMSVNETAVDQIKFNVFPNMMPNLRGLIAQVGGDLMNPRWVQLLTVVTSVGILLWTARQRKGHNPSSQLISAVIIVCLLSYHLMFHDLSILVVPLACILNDYLSPKLSNAISGSAAMFVFAAPAIIGLFAVRPWVIAIPVLFLWFTETRSDESKTVLRRTIPS
jgi:Glycosyltransferase family 87